MATSALSLLGTSTQTATTPTSAASAASTATDPLAQEQTFLQLLVAQIENQDPMTPMDGIQFVTQLAQFSELEQVSLVRSDLEGLAANVDTALGDPTVPAATTGSTNSTGSTAPTTGN
jgi:flagellar basal-body rod modification protein FlgD